MHFPVYKDTQRETLIMITIIKNPKDHALNYNRPETSQKRGRGHTLLIEGGGIGETIKVFQMLCTLPYFIPHPQSSRPPSSAHHPPHSRPHSRQRPSSGCPRNYPSTRSMSIPCALSSSWALPPHRHCRPPPSSPS